MSARILDGKQISRDLLGRIAAVVKARKQQGFPPPGLAVILVGADPASAVYVRNKRRACLEIGFRSFDFDFPANVSQHELLALIDKLNIDPAVHGILVQSPLPAHVDEDALVDRIDPEKDVDGFHPVNLGHLALRRLGMRPCTSKGVMTLLGHTDRPVRGRHAVIVGVSNHVGRPLALELLIAGATTTCCHKFTRDLPGFVGQADILVVAAGKPGLVQGEWIKPGAVVIDVGINRLASGKLVGDVEFDVASQRASWITPVPGGVGPMTVATLMENTLDAACGLQGGS